MSRRRATYNLRRVSTLLLVGVLVLFGMFAVQRARSLREEGARSREDQARRELANLVGLWEGFVTDRVRAWLVEMPEAQDLPLRQLQQRQAIPWFDAYYQWRMVDNEVQFMWPLPAGPEALQSQMDAPCMADANRLRITGKLEAAAQAFESCDAEPTLLARYLAASVHVERGAPADAVRTLEASPSPLRRELALAAGAGLPIRRLFATRDIAVSALQQVGREGRAQKLATATIREVSRLNGPDLAEVLDGASSLLVDAAPSDRPELQAGLERARRRLFAYNEIRGRLGAATAARASGPTAGDLHFVHDTYNRPGFLLVWTTLDDGSLAAVQIDADRLLHTLVDSLKTSAEPDLQILDHDNRRVDGSGDRVAGVVLKVPLGRLLPQLSLGLVSKPGSQSGEVLEFVLTQLGPLGIGLLLAVLAFMTHMTAEARELELMARQEAFITRVTHELKTPLAGIRVMAETLQLGAANDPSTRDRFLNRILQEASNLETRIDEVLQAAWRPKVRSLQVVQADQLARTVVARWEPRFAQAGATLILDLQPTPNIEVDPTLIGDALSNLIDNALKYRKTGQPGRCWVHTGVSGRWVVFEVSDNGIGVPKEMRKRIFERFTRVEGDGRGKSGGHGLGLAFVAEAAAAHGGLVECSAGPEGGTRFRIKLRRH